MCKCASVLCLLCLACECRLDGDMCVLVLMCVCGLVCTCIYIYLRYLRFSLMFVHHLKQRDVKFSGWRRWGGRDVFEVISVLLKLHKAVVVQVFTVWCIGLPVFCTNM